MVVGAVAEVLEDVAALGERRLADPVGALAAHLGEALGVAVHPLHHVVAADAGVGARAFGHDGRGVVRAAGAEIGDAGRNVGGSCQPRLRRLQAARRGACSRCFRRCATSTRSPIATAISIGVKRALGREERAPRPRPSCRRPSAHRLCRRAFPCTCASISERFSSTTMMKLEPCGESADAVGRRAARAGDLVERGGRDRQPSPRRCPSRRAPGARRDSSCRS